MPKNAAFATSHPTPPRNAQHDWKYISKKQALLSMFSASLLPLDPPRALDSRVCRGLFKRGYLLEAVFRSVVATHLLSMAKNDSFLDQITVYMNIYDIIEYRYCLDLFRFV